MRSVAGTLRTAALGARDAYEADGFCFAPRLADEDLVAEANQICDRIIAADYVTGVAPLAASWRPGDPPDRLVKIDQPQRADHALSGVLERSGIGEAAAALTGASMVQVWAVQLLHKPPATDPASVAIVGWHQDDDYWSEWWEGEAFTCWLALSDVRAESGPMRFVRGSHRWGFLKAGNFFSPDLEGIREGMPVPEGEVWEEVPAIMSPGEATFHHRRTVHGSGINTSARPRRSLAVHLRTEKSRPLDLAPPGYQEELDDPRICPVLYGGTSAFTA